MDFYQEQLQDQRTLALPGPSLSFIPLDSLAMDLPEPVVSIALMQIEREFSYKRKLDHGDWISFLLELLHGWISWLRTLDPGFRIYAPLLKDLRPSWNLAPYPAQDAIMRNSALMKLPGTSSFIARDHMPGVLSAIPFALHASSWYLDFRPSWATTAEGPQNFQDFPDNGSVHSGEAEEFIYTSGQTTPRGTRLDRAHIQGRQDMHTTWTTSRTATATMPQGGQAMSRVSSSRSCGSSLSRASQLSNMNVTGNVSAFRNGSQAGSTMSGIDSCLLLDSETDAMTSQMYWPGYSLDMGMNTDATFSLSEASPVHVVPAHMQLGPDLGLVDHSPSGSWDCFSSSHSRSSSPIDDLWLGQSPNSSPELQCQQSPSLDRKVPAISDDLNKTIIPQLDDTLSLPPPYIGARRQITEGESARDHDLYKKAAPMDDGLYHCPWEGQTSCNHKAEKLKCNYDKFVDSHLKPYRCKSDSCEGARFSSTACLLRHEREAHGLHGHGEKPFLCVYDGCERAAPGNGFPRQWNLRDHMKRVHNDHGSSSGSPPLAPTQQPAKGRKRKTDVPEIQAITSRKASVKAMPAPEPKQSSTRPLLDQWMDHRKAVENLFRGLVKPEDARNIQQITDMQQRLAAMVKVTSDLNGIASADAMPTIGRGTFVGTGNTLLSATGKEFCRMCECTDRRSDVQNKPWTTQHPKRTSDAAGSLTRTMRSTERRTSEDDDTCATSPELQDRKAMESQGQGHRIPDWNEPLEDMDPARFGRDKIAEPRGG
ncbi:hypothetical protein G7046_g8686 [Stylonectria norvegica]|nr:hypothetical protein G7046_g8686 [Stylonectria norvegica]